MDEVDKQEYYSQETPTKQSESLFQMYSDRAIRKPQNIDMELQTSQKKKSESNQQDKHSKTEIVQMNLIAFYEQNLQNLKQLIIERDEDIKIRDEKILEQSILVNLMLSQFNKIVNLLEKEKKEIIDKFMITQDELQNITHKHQELQQSYQMAINYKTTQQLQQQFQQYLQNFSQPQDYDQRILELQEAKSQLNNSKTQIINLEVKVKETEVKLEESNLKLNEAYMRVDFLEKEIANMETQNITLDKQFKTLLLQFEQYQQIQKKQIQQQQFRGVQSQINTNQNSEQQILQNVNLNSNKQDNDNLINTYTQFKKQNSVKQFQQNQQQQKIQNDKLETIQQQHYGGILNFPSDFRSQQQKELEILLTNQLSDLVAKKQTFESELNKKSNLPKNVTEKRKREQLEQELDNIQDQINKVKLKLRENKFI